MLLSICRCFAAAAAAAADSAIFAFMTAVGAHLLAPAVPTPFLASWISATPVGAGELVPRAAAAEGHLGGHASATLSASARGISPCDTSADREPSRMSMCVQAQSIISPQQGSAGHHRELAGLLRQPNITQNAVDKENIKDLTSRGTSVVGWLYPYLHKTGHMR